MNFRKELEELINKASRENDSDTPDWILAQYLDNCLNTFTVAVRDRDRWWGFKTWSNNEEVEDNSVQRPSDVVQP